MSDPLPHGPYQPAPGGPPPNRSWLLPHLLLGLVFVIAVVAVAALVTFRVLRDQEDPDTGGPTVLSRPVRFLAVQKSEPGPCKPGLLPDLSSVECLQVGSGMTIGRVADIRVRPPDAARGRTSHVVAISLIRQDAQTFATMTTKAAQAQPPANRIAIIAEGRVLSAPAVTSPITGGEIEITGSASQFTKEYTEGLVHRITGR
ncbi:hypothetical protein ABZ801_36080 [Actinomadura sp. NPDC047616]|uniref:SecDF P1 head subdomain-containing protein n=1 Tax=Actinomadura sp. NPDC047616 TaxID=3155914 RepID=UPI0033DAEF16